MRPPKNLTWHKKIILWCQGSIALLRCFYISIYIVYYECLLGVMNVRILMLKFSFHFMESLLKTEYRGKECKCEVEMIKMKNYLRPWKVFLIEVAAFWWKGSGFVSTRMESLIFPLTGFPQIHTTAPMNCSQFLLNLLCTTARG